MLVPGLELFVAAAGWRRAAQRSAKPEPIAPVEPRAGGRARLVLIEGGRGVAGEPGRPAPERRHAS